jgi:hypothetical protein
MEEEEGRSCGSKVLEIYFSLILAIYTPYCDSFCMD